MGEHLAILKDKEPPVPSPAPAMEIGGPVGEAASPVPVVPHSAGMEFGRKLDAGYGSNLGSFNQLDACIWCPGLEWHKVTICQQGSSLPTWVAMCCYTIVYS